MHTETKIVGQVFIIRLFGDTIDLVRCIEGLITHGCKKIIIHLTSVKKITEAGREEIVSVCQDYQQRGIQIRFVEKDRTRREKIATKYIGLTIYPSEDKALEALKNF